MPSSFTTIVATGLEVRMGVGDGTPPTPDPAALVLTADDTGTVGVAGSALVSNTGGTSGSWSLSASPSGLTPTPSSGSTAAGGSTSISLAYSGAATYSLTLTSAESVTGSPQSIVVSDAPVMPTTATLSGSSTAYTGSAHASTVTLDEAADQTYTITWSRSDGGTGSATSTITAGNTSASADSTWGTTGSRTVDFTISPSLTRAGRPLTVTVSDYVEPAPSASIVQYVTHDGDDVGNVSTSSAPSATMWNTVLQVPWANTNGDWLDATETEQGSTEWASSAALNALGRYSITVTSLVQRWQSNGMNRGFFLKYSANAFPVTFAGRTAATDADRPKLVVTTALGTFTITARCNAHFEHGSNQVRSGSDEWVVGSGYSAVLQFDLSSIVGAATSATLDVTVTAQDQTGMVLKVFEANPPTLLDPATNATPVTGIGSGTWAALQAHGSTIFADDWRTGGALDFTGANYEIPHADGRSTDAVTGRTKMAAHIQSGQLLGASVKVDVVESDTAGGVTQAANRRSELYARARMYFDANFASTVERIKIPAIGCQLGYWVTSSGGYWETNLTGGNGGAQATGTKVWLSSINGGAGGWGYSGHSSRLLIGLRNTDTSAYAGLVSVSAYIYNLDQGGPFPAEERFPGGVVLSLGRDYEFEFRQKLNTYTGSTDADGNYATANADGIYQVWINGTLCYDKQTFRWVKHPEFSVQGFWFDVYHGGVGSAIAQHDFEMGEMAMASVQIGASAAYPWAASLSSNTWTALSGGDIYSWADGGGIPGSFYPSNYQAFRNFVNDYCGPAVDHDEGAAYYYGGGHDSGFMNGVVKRDWKTLGLSLLVDPTPSAKIPASGGTPVGTYPSGLAISWYFPAPPLTDAADLAYATPLARPSTHMYRAAVKRGSEVWYFYNGFGIADIASGTWRGYDLRGVLEAQCTALYPADLGRVFQQGTVAIYDSVTDRFFVTRNPGDTDGSLNGLVVIDPTVPEVTDYIVPSSTLGGTYGNVYASMSVAKCGRYIYYFNKTNGNYGSNNAMNQGFRLNMDTLAVQAFTVTGDTSGTVWTDNGWSETIPAGSDGTLIWRWNYANQPTKAYKIDPSSYTGTGTSGDPFVYTQTEVALSGSAPSPKYLYELPYIPGADAFVFDPHAEVAPRAIRLA